MSSLSNINIDITMTAVIRPTIIRSTVKDISRHIVDVNKNCDFRLIINIDPIGEDLKAKSILEVIKDYFTPDKIIYRMPEKASFPKAVKWVWNQSTAAYIFHIEDDWAINRPVDVNKMVSILNKYPKLSSLRLFKFNTPKNNCMKTFECKWDYNEDGFYLARDWKKQFGLNPILIKRKFITEALPLMKDEYNPEKQFRSSQEYMVPLIKKWEYAIFSSPGDKALVSDSGRAWIRNTPYSKARNFITWEKRK